ncbi:MAG TPA: DNA internalization-related competence protein ComEC/Rec2, partial [Syntrophomonadaceae bacterium]|nr:DNA internalization-related competence protein ComEC/Rec2 [Syntrophomonadaceae bacterium]
YIELSGKLTPPLAPGNPGEFDYPSYLAKENIFYILNLKEATDIKLLKQNTNIVYNLTSAYRHKIVSLSEEALGYDTASILLGMLLGKKENMDEKQYRDFQKTGIVHVFAVSGLHVGFLLLFCHGITSLLALSSRNRFYFSLIILLAYGTVVGWPISVIRASIMAGLSIFALYVSRERSLLDCLGLAGIIIIFLDPHAPFKVAFQLSFVATWGLIYLYPLIKNSLAIENKFLAYLLIPLAAQLPTIPFIAYHFNLLTPISILTNVLLTYIIGIVVIAGFILITFMIFLPALFTFFIMPIGALINFVLLINDSLVNLPWAYIYVATPHILLIGIYFLALALFIYYLKDITRNSYLIAALLLITVFILVICLPANLFNRGKLEVVALDVGQGDSILLKSPQGKFILVDGGGSDFTDVGQRKVLAYLHHRGIRDLYLAVNTHPDTDHLLGLETVVNDISVKHIGIPATLKDEDKYQELKDIASSKNIPLTTLHKGQILKIEPGFNLEVIYPALDNELKTVDNDQSVVLLGKYKSFSILLTGDIEKKGIEKMVSEYDLPMVTVLKIPHHGSKGSLVAKLYEETKPKYGIISAGKNNNFGHPHQDVLHQLDDIGAISLRTDLGGLIQIITDGENLSIKRPMAN